MLILRYGSKSVPKRNEIPLLTFEIHAVNNDFEGMMAKDHGSSIKDDDTYEALRDDGYSKSTAARIANAQANSDQKPSKKGGQAPAYEEWSKDELYDRAQELDIEGRSDMNKDELIKALRESR